MKKNKLIHQTTIGIDLGDKKHAICALGKDGEVLQEFTIRNDAEALLGLAEAYPKARVAMEVGTHSPWISRLLKGAGLEVIVANARRLRAIYDNDRKCDRTDAMMLARIARLDSQMLHPIKHISEPSQRDMLLLKLRDSLVRQRVGLVNCARACLKSLGLRIKLKTSAASVPQVREALSSHDAMLAAVLEPILAAIEESCKRIAEYDQQIARAIEERHPQAAKLRSIGGVGPITSLGFVLSIEDPERFKDARDVGAYVGLVPRRDQSGNSDKQLPISKTGSTYLRKLLVQCAHYILGPFGKDCELRRHGHKLMGRGGKAAKKRATVAVARKLAVVMLTLWKKQTDYQPLRQAA